MNINVSCPCCLASNRLRGASKEATTVHRIKCRRCKEKIQVTARPEKFTFGVAHHVSSIGYEFWD